MWELEASIRADLDTLLPYLRWIEQLDPEVDVNVEGPSEVGVCRVIVRGPVTVSDDVDLIFGRLEQDRPGSILREHLS